MSPNEWSEKIIKPKTTAAERLSQVAALGGEGAYVRKIGSPDALYRIWNVISNGWVQIELVHATGRARPATKGRSGLLNPLTLEKADPPHV